MEEPPRRQSIWWEMGKSSQKTKRNTETLRVLIQYKQIPLFVKLLWALLRGVRKEMDFVWGVGVETLVSCRHPPFSLLSRPQGGGCPSSMLSPKSLQAPVLSTQQLHRQERAGQETGCHLCNTLRRSGQQNRDSWLSLIMVSQTWGRMSLRVSPTHTQCHQPQVALEANWHQFLLACSWGLYACIL